MLTLEEQVLSFCKAKDIKSAFDLVYAEVGQTLRGVCTNLTGSFPESEDAFQDLCMAIYVALPRFRGDAKIQTWCYRIAVRIALRAKSRGPRRTVALDVEQLSVRNEPSDSLEQKDEENRVRDAIMGLGADYRVAITLSLLEGLSAGEIADILGVEVGTIWTRLHRARQALTKVLKEQGSLPAGG